MTVWRYKALPLASPSSAAQAGELSGESAADVRAALRRIGLQVIEVRPARRERAGGAGLEWWRSHLRHRRRSRKAELYDSVATMLDAGMPLVESISALTSSEASRAKAAREMLVHVREALRAGSSLAEAMHARPAWFDAAEIAMVEAGQLAGELPVVLRSLADRHERSGELGNRLAQALTYPAIISVVGVGVVIFLSTKTLPNLVSILADAKIPTPHLTEIIMAIGQSLARGWPLLLLLAVAGVGGTFAAMTRLSKRDASPPMWIRRRVPRVLRRLALARMTIGLADLVRTGVPLVEAVRAVVPTLSGVTSSGLRRRLLDAASRVERGEALSEALDDPIWFDEELRRMLQVAERSGELDTMLRRLGERTERQARRLIDRLAALLEPCAIVLLAALVGIVVMAAILPLIRMQEVIR